MEAMVFRFRSVCFAAAFRLAHPGLLALPTPAQTERRNASVGSGRAEEDGLAFEPRDHPLSTCVAGNYAVGLWRGIRRTSDCGARCYLANADHTRRYLEGYGPQPYRMDHTDLVGHAGDARERTLSR